MTDTLVRIASEFVAADGNRVVVEGRYEVVARPTKGTVKKASSRRDAAVVVLEDGTEIWLEPLDRPESRRSGYERCRLSGRQVRVRGRAHARMPSSGAAPLVLCLSELGRLERKR